MERNPSHEYLDTSPVARPVGFRAPPSLQEMIRMYVRTELSREADRQGHETFEEADDFDVGDDYEPRSQWELSQDQLDFKEEPIAQAAPPSEPSSTPAAISKADDSRAAPARAGSATQGEPVGPKP